MNWDFPLGSGHFGVSGAFLMKQISFTMMKRMSLKRIMDNDEFEEDEESDGSEPMPYQPRDWPFKAKNKAFLNKPIHLGPYRSTLFPIQGCPCIFRGLLCSWRDSKSKGDSSYPNQKESFEIYSWQLVFEYYSRKVLQKCTSTGWLIARDALDPIVYHLEAYTRGGSRANGFNADSPFIQ
jgi:hypothetical protein